nr:hypothetical protein [Tanacetum cinerariifolium]
MTAILKQFQATPPLASVKAVEEICFTCGGAHPYYQYLAADGNTFSKLQDNIQGYVSAATVNFNQDNSGYRPPAVILTKLPEKLGDPRKFLIPCGFSELKCKALADLVGIARDVFVPVGKFSFTADFVIVDYESDPKVPLILGRPFLGTTHALIDVYEEEMILYDGDERLTLNMRHGTSSYSNQPKKESINMINIFNDLSEDFLKDLFATNHLSGNPTFSSHTNLTLPEVKDDIFDSKGDIVLDSTKDLPPPHNINPLSGSTTSSSPNHLLEEKWILFSRIRLINLADLNDNLVDTMPEMFTEEYALDYSSPSLYDEYDDDLFEVESDTEYVYDDPLTPRERKLKSLNS